MRGPPIITTAALVAAAVVVVMGGCRNAEGSQRTGSLNLAARS
uniref:Uncharacterized protein n=1 Tax=Sphingomonas sp. JE1 TaxID=1628059 RepID=A0A0D4ZZ90_9SPHN|nr:hypothetical protein pJE1_140 [Sphingomonas sp. JE1]